MFKMATIKQVQQLIQQGVFSFVTDFKDAYMFVPIGKQADGAHQLWLVVHLKEGKL